jgi:hypothetical protein
LHDPDEFAPRRPRLQDLRADYDDDFARVVTPRDVARRRLMVPAIGLMLTGLAGVLSSLIGAVALAVAFSELPMYVEEWILLSFLLAVLATTTYLFTFVLLGGLAMRRLRKYPLARFAVWFVTALSLFSPYTILVFPFGIWGLISLYALKARKQFDLPEGATAEEPAPREPERPPAKVESGDQRNDYDDQFGKTHAVDEAIARRLRFPARWMIITGGLICLAMMIVSSVFIVIAWLDSSRYADDEAVNATLLCGCGGVFGLLLIYAGWCMLKLRNYGWALVGAYAMTLLALGGLSGALFYPFGIWALVLLHDPDIIRGFPGGRRSAQRISPLLGVWRIGGFYLDTRSLVTVGILLVVFPLALLGVIWWDAYIHNEEWDVEDVLGISTVTGVPISLGLLAIVYGRAKARKSRRTT